MRRRNRTLGKAAPAATFCAQPTASQTFVGIAALTLVAVLILPSCGVGESASTERPSTERAEEPTSVARVSAEATDATTDRFDLGHLDPSARDRLREAIRAGLRTIPADGWMANRGARTMAASERKRLTRSTERLIERNGPESIGILREFESSRTGDPSESDRGARSALARVELIRGKYRPEVDPGRPDVFDPGVVERLLRASYSDCGYPEGERLAARSVFLDIANAPEAARRWLGGLPEPEREEQVFAIRSALYDVAAVQALVVRYAQPLSRDQCNQLVDLFTITEAGWRISDVQSMLARQKYDVDSDGFGGVPYLPAGEVRNAYNAVAKAKREVLERVLDEHQVEVLYGAGSYDSGAYWFARRFQAAPLYPPEWPMDPLPKVLLRPDPEGTALLEELSPAW